MSDLRGWRVRRRMRMPPARVIAGPRALLTSILVVVTRVPFRSGAGRANPRIQITPGAGSSFRGSTGTFVPRDERRSLQGKVPEVGSAVSRAAVAETSHRHAPTVVTQLSRIPR